MNDKRWAVFLLLIVLVGCSPQTRKSGGHFNWESGWIYGNTPPQRLLVAKQCPNFITELKPEYQLHGGFGLDKAAPVFIKASCVPRSAIIGMESEGRLFRLQGSSPDTVLLEKIESAAETAILKNEPVYVLFW